MHFKTEYGLDIAELHLMAGSKVLDLEKKSKSYQDKQLTYDEVIQDVLNDFEKGAYIIVDEMWQKEIGRPIIRYKETAWEFIKRLASHYRQSVFSDVRSGNPRVYRCAPGIYSVHHWSFCPAR